jgi:hypothetical protein
MWPRVAERSSRLGPRGAQLGLGDDRADEAEGGDSKADTGAQATLRVGYGSPSQASLMADNASNAHWLRRAECTIATKIQPGSRCPTVLSHGRGAMVSQIG